MIQMTREEYQRKYGTLPQTQPQAQQAQPIQMTREQYRQIYGVAPGQQVAPSNVGEFVTGMVKNIPKSGVNLVKDVWSGVTSLPSTIGSVASGETKLGDIASGIGQSFKQRYLDKGALKNTLYNDPLGLAADASMVLGGGAAAVKAGSTAARVAGATKAASNLSKAGRALTTASRATDPIMAVGKAGRGIISKGVRNLDDYGRGYATAGMGNPAQISKADDILSGIKTQAIDPVTGKSVTKPMNTAEFISQNNLYARNPDELAKYGKTLMKQFDTIANNPSLQVKATTVIKPLDELIELTKQAVKDFPGESAYKTQLKELSRQKVSIIKKSKNGVIPGNVALRLRRGLEAVSSRSSSMGVAQKPGEALARQKMVSGLRAGLREADPRLSEIGKQLQAIGFDAPGKEGPLLKAFKGFESRGQARNPITLSNVTSTGLSSGVGALLGGAPGAVVAPMAYSLFNRAVTSPGGIKATSQAAKSVARGIGTATRKASPIMSFGTRNVGQPARVIKKGQEMPPTDQEKRQPKGLQSYDSIIPENLFSRIESAIDNKSREMARKKVDNARNKERIISSLKEKGYDPELGVPNSLSFTPMNRLTNEERRYIAEASMLSAGGTVGNLAGRTLNPSAAVLKMSPGELYRDVLEASKKMFNKNLAIQQEGADVLLEAARRQGINIKEIDDDLAGKILKSLEKEIKQTVAKPQSTVGGVAKKYDTTYNLNNPDDIDYLERIFSKDQIDNFKKGNFEHWRGGGKEYFEKIVRGNIETTKYTKPELKLSPYKGTTTFYHGTAPQNIEAITSGGFVRGSDLPEDAFRSGGYGKMQKSVSLSSDPMMASRFTGSGNQGALIETKIKPNAKIVTAKGVEYAEELNDYADDLLKKGIDAVWIGGGEKELVVLNPKVIETGKSKVFNVINAKQELSGFSNVAQAPVSDIKRKATKLFSR